MNHSPEPPQVPSHDHDHDRHDHGCYEDHDHSGHSHDDHDHDHHHHGLFGHHHHAPSSFGGAFALGIGLNTAYVIAEIIWGVFAHSVALLADAGHNLSDILALIAAWVAAVLSRRAPSEQFTYGLRRSSILSALGNAVFLLIITGGIAWEALLRLFHPEPVAGRTVMIVAALGILVNGGTALLFVKGQKNDLNLRGVFLHMATDAIASFAVVVTGGLIMLTGLLWLDPAVSLAISALIVAATWSLLRDSLSMALDGVPAEISTTGVREALLDLPDVVSVHDLHIWSMSTTETAMTAHLVRNGSEAESTAPLLEAASDVMRTRFGISHTTLQIELTPCDTDCFSPGHSHD